MILSERTFVKTSYFKVNVHNSVHIKCRHSRFYGNVFLMTSQPNQHLSKWWYDQTLYKPAASDIHCDSRRINLCHRHLQIQITKKSLFLLGHFGSWTKIFIFWVKVAVFVVFEGCRQWSDALCRHLLFYGLGTYVNWPWFFIVQKNLFWWQLRIEPRFHPNNKGQVFLQKIGHHVQGVRKMWRNEKPGWHHKQMFF